MRAFFGLVLCSACTAPSFDTAMVLSVDDQIDGCFDEQGTALVVDLFEYEGDREPRSAISGACARCTDGSGTCTFVERHCECTVISNADALLESFRRTRFADLDEEKRYCVRVAVSSSACDPATCVSQGEPLRGPVCVLSDVVAVGRSELPAFIGDLSCSRTDAGMEICRDERCDCLLSDTLSCAQVPRPDSCDIGCLPSVRMGCFQGSPSCFSLERRRLTTSECFSIGAEGDGR